MLVLTPEIYGKLLKMSGSGADFNTPKLPKVDEPYVAENATGVGGTPSSTGKSGGTAINLSQPKTLGKM
jgi:hypothetical protein